MVVMVSYSLLPPWQRQPWFTSTSCHVCMFERVHMRCFLLPRLLHRIRCRLCNTIMAAFEKCPYVLVNAQAELKVGEKLSDYPDYYRVLQASDGSSVAMSKYLNKNPLVVFFYPRAGETITHCDVKPECRACLRQRCSRNSWPLRHTRLHEAGVQLQGQLRRVPGEPVPSPDVRMEMGSTVTMCKQYYVTIRRHLT